MEVAPLERINVRSDSHEQLKDITQDVNEALRGTGLSEATWQGVYLAEFDGRAGARCW